jgi:DNA-binding CsgD family transcriptional regulator
MYATSSADVHLDRTQILPLDSSSDFSVSPLTAAVPPPSRTGEAREQRLRGRRGERETLDRLVASVRAGNGRALVVRGDAGAGKTALLDYLLERAWGCRAVRAAGVESEMDLPFAGLHQLCAPFLDRIERLPEPQRDALGTAFSLRGGDAPDRFAVGLAVLGLLAEVAAERPLVCVVDDAQWLDRASAQALAFIARHLAAGPVAVLIAVRSSGAEQYLAGLAQLVVRELADADSRALLDSAVIGPLDERVRDRIVAETRGNPRALLEVACGLTPGDLAGGFGLPGAAAPLDRTEETFGQRLALLPPATRLLLLVAATEPIHDPALVWRAAGQLGVKAEAAAPAAVAGVIESGGQIRFRHPLARAAVYRTASPEERRRVHLALAETTDPDADPERRAWHRAHAAPGLDESVAAELERSADRARARGGLAAAAAFRERAAELTPEPARRAERALAAAQVKHQAGAPEAARRLLDMAHAGPLDELGRARVERLSAQLAADAGRGHGAPSLLKAAKRLEPLHPGLARETYRDAFGAALTVGRLALFGGIPEVAAAALAAPPTPQPLDGPDLLLNGLAVLTTEGYAAGAPMLQRALSVWRDAEVPTGEGLHWLLLACRMSHAVWDDQSWSALTARLIGLARHAGALRVLPAALVSGVAVQLLAGKGAMAAAMAEEAEAVARATGNPTGPYGSLMLAAWQGGQAETFRLMAAATREMMARGEGQWLTAVAWATAVLNNGLGRYDEALAAAEQGTEYPHELGLATWSTAELIEAAARAGAPERAAGAMARLSETTTASGTDWALGIQARCRALLSDGESAERLYLEAITRLGRTRIRAELARAYLLYGEWLRRQNRRIDARDPLRLAYQMLAEMGFEGFAERARRELLATGETVRKRTIDTASELTAQETQIARLADDGHTNTEIGGRLFISGRTVEWHLHKVFAKLGISCRKELREALPELEQLALPAWSALARRAWQRSAQAVAARDGGPTEAQPGPFGPVRLRPTGGQECRPPGPGQSGRRSPCVATEHGAVRPGGSRRDPPR